MFKNLEKFLEALWPSKCLSCDQVTQTRIFCRLCEPSIRTADSHEAIFLFSGPVKQVIQQAKFKPDESKARELMRFISQLPSPLTPLADGEWNIHGIVFIPVHWRRRLKRGFDLSALFALTLSKQLNLPVYDWLRNTRFDKALTLSTSKSERMALTQGRYQIRRHAPPKNILLVDDVVTTGATLEAAKSVLIAAGHQVKCFALAKTPRQQ